MNEENKRIQHPSFGVITVTRATCNAPQPLFGSSITHHNMIRLELHTASVERHLSTDWISKERKLFEVEMSQNQWAEFVSSIGNGGGTPCTIRWDSNGSVADCPFNAKREEFYAEFKAVTEKASQDVLDAIAAAQELLDKKSVTKSDRLELTRYLTNIKNGLKHTIPFIEKQFEEQVERTTTEAKAEIEAHIIARTASVVNRLEGELPPT